MKKNSSFDVSQVHLLQTELQRFEVGCKDGTIVNQEKIQSFGFNIEHNTAFSSEHRIVRVVFRITIDVNTEGGIIQQACKSSISFLFKVDNLQECLTPAKDKSLAEMDGVLGVTLVSVAYSTARGILIARLAGTFLEGAMLPIMDSNELTKAEKTYANR